jgi:hypothetical protein
MLNSLQVFILCLTSAMFIVWVLALKRQTIRLLAEANKLRLVAEPGSARANQTKMRTRTAILSDRRDDHWISR